MATSGRSRKGSTFTYELSYPTNNALAIFILGLGNQQRAGNILPLNMAGFGMPCCQLQVRPDVRVFTTLANGSATLNWQLPTTPALAGIVIYAQAFVTDPGANTAGAILSNDGQSKTGVF